MEIEPPKKQLKTETKKSLRVEVVDIVERVSQKIVLKARQINNRDDNKSNGTDNSLHDTKDLIDIVIEGIWTQGHISKNTILHLVNSQYDTTANTYSINNSVGLLVIEPDNLLTCTLVASSLFCERKTWLNNVFAGQVGTNRAMLVGTLVHEVFQYGVKNKIADLEKLTKFLDEQLDDATIMLEIYSVESKLKDIRDEAIAYLSSVKEWIEKYMLTGPRYPLTNAEDLEVKVVGVSDIEENVWSTKYGLKGKIDVTGSVRVYDKKSRTLVDKTLPLELKTGNPNLSSSHAAQVSLYSMMIEDRYAETNQGLVIYLKNKAAMHNVTLTHNIKRDLIQRRNQINYYLKSYYLGPEMLDQPRVCKNCERLTECILMSEMYSPGDLSHYSTMGSLRSDAVGHLDDEFKKFFKTYHEKLVSMLVQTETLEGDNPNLRSKGSFWNYSSEEAEAKGTGFGKLQATYCKGKEGFITFKRHPDHKPNLLPNVPTKENGQTKQAVKKQRIEDYFKPAKSIAEPTKKMKAFNTSLNFSRCRIAISLDQDLSDMETQNSATALAIGFMSDIEDDHFVIKIYEGAPDLFRPELMYRVDKIEKKTNLDIERLVLVRLLLPEDWRCDRVRQLLLNPKYEPVENLELNLFVLSAEFEEIKELPEKHQKFVVEAVSTDNYFILNEKVEPDTMKIHFLIAQLTRVICQLNRSVLIVAQNIDDLVDLMRRLQKKVRFILIDDGKSTKARYQYASNLVKVPQSDNIELSKKFESYIRQHELATVVITTYAMSIGGLVFTRRTFDYCIAYDCDSTELLVSLSPMFCSDRHIIIDVNDQAKTTNGAHKDKDISLGCHLRSIRSYD